MLAMMQETRETVNSEESDHWSDQAIDFIQATSLVSPDQLSDVSICKHCHEISTKIGC
jgi:hypothetical protein